MKRCVIFFACIFPIIPLWFFLSHLAEHKYRIFPASEYWESRLNGQPEFFHSEGFIWFAPPEVYFHGYWPRRAPENEIDAAFLPAWDKYILGLVSNTNHWDTNVVQKLCLLTGANCGTNQAAWAKWKIENKVTKESALLLLPKPQNSESELVDFFQFHVRNRYWLVAFESVFYCLLWTILVLLPNLHISDRLKPLKWGLIAWCFSMIAFLPLMCGYGSGAFTTWQGQGLCLTAEDIFGMVSSVMETQSPTEHSLKFLEVRLCGFYNTCHFTDCWKANWLCSFIFSLST